MTWVVSGICAAVALMIMPASGWVIARIDPPPPRRNEPTFLKPRKRAVDKFALAAGFDLFAVCLRAGMPVSAAATVVATSAPSELASALTRASELLALGADPQHAWETPPGSSTEVQELCALARRSARAGSSPARGLAELAVSQRALAADSANAAAERAGVAISGPLGLCFLPAFICLGIVPVVVGLASHVLSGGLM